jgi:Nucleotidyl transferase AbiEii toxin, Type IV TA system
MNGYLALSLEEQRAACLLVQDALQLHAGSVEKDFWVCWTLRELFTLPDIRTYLTFKGGTSLSKAWKLIHRFSEDLDLVVDKEVLGFGGAASPDQAPSQKQRRVRNEALMSACRDWVQKTLMPTLSAKIEATLGASGWQLEVDPDMPDGQCLLFHYPSAFSPESPGYVRPVVKIELGARSDDWPHVDKVIQSYVTERFPALGPDTAFSVRVLSVERTFWEKACLLHEETFRPVDGSKPRKFRMARHYYDLWCLLIAGVGERAIAETALFKRVAEHREIFFRYSWVDYSTHKPGSFRLSPPEDHIPMWMADYKAMQGPMFFGPTPSFEEMMVAVSQFEKTFNATANG